MRGGPEGGGFRTVADEKEGGRCAAWAPTTAPPLIPPCRLRAPTPIAPPTPRSFVFNSIEDDRSGMSSNVGNRPAKELYYRPFQSAVDAGVGSAMCS